MTPNGQSQSWVDKLEAKNGWAKLSFRRRLGLASLSFVLGFLPIVFVVIFIYRHTGATALIYSTAGCALLVALFLSRLVVAPHGGFRISITVLKWILFMGLIGAAAFVILLMALPDRR